MNNYGKDFHEMNAQELLAEVRTWRARALQNLAETRAAQAELELKNQQFSRERGNLIRLRDSSRDREAKLKNKITELESELKEASDKEGAA